MRLLSATVAFFLLLLSAQAAAPAPPCAVAWFPANDTFPGWEAVRSTLTFVRPLPPALHFPKIGTWEIAACSFSGPDRKMRLPYPEPRRCPGGKGSPDWAYWQSSDVPDAAHLHDLAGLGEGTFLCALLADGIRCSNVIRITVRSGYNPGAEPVVRVAAIQPLRGKSIDAVGVWIVPPSLPRDPNLTNMAAAFPRLQIDGKWYQPSMAWSGPVGPLPPGAPVSGIHLLGGYGSPGGPAPAFVEKARIRARIGEADPRNGYLSEEIEITADDTTDRFDRAFEAEGPSASLTPEDVAAIRKLAEIPPASVPIPFQEWKNPEITLGEDGIYVSPTREAVPHGKVLQALAALPKEAWPGGRIVRVCNSCFRARAPDVYEKGSAEVMARLKAAGIAVVLLPSG